MKPSHIRITRTFQATAAISIFLLLLWWPANLAAVDFAPAKSYPVGTSPAAIAVGDFNGDGKIDIAVANTGSGDVSILLGNGDGTFQPAVNYSAGNSPSTIAVGDFNGDGKLDLAVFQPAAKSVSGSVSILLGNGDGTFQAPKTLALSVSASFMAVADFNVDKKSDLAVCDAANIDILIGNGDGTFQPAKQTALLANCGALVAADFNGDAKPDVAIVVGTQIQVWTGKGDGTFSQGATLIVNYDPAGNRIDIGTMATVDVNHDGKTDLLVNSSQLFPCPVAPPCVNGPGTSTKASLFLGNGDGSFQLEQVVASSFTSEGSPGATLVQSSVADFNGDGKPDLVFQMVPMSHTLSHFLAFQLGKGDGSFPVSLPDVPISDGTIQVAYDLNGDKLADLIAVGTANNIEVLLNTSPTSGADLGLISSSLSPPTAAVGANVTITADVFNLGPQDATGVTFTDKLPNGVSFVSAMATPGSCVQSQGIVSCSIGALASVFDSKVNIVVTPTVVGAISNSMNVTANEPDPVPGNNSATQTGTVLPAVTLTVTTAGVGSGTVTSSPDGINCGSTCSANFPQGTSVGLTANPAAGSVFSQWSGGCTGGTIGCGVTMNSAQAVTATFALAPDFTLASASSTLTLKTGGQTTDALTLIGQNGFSGQVNLSCMVSGPAPLAACTVSPASVMLGTSTANSTLSVSAPTSLGAFTVPFGGTTSMATYAAVMPLPVLLFGGLALASRGSMKRQKTGRWLLRGSLLVLFSCMAGCGGSSTPPPTKNYTVTVTATSATASVEHTANVSVAVD
jgi:uncharacterized repeat protein (TIGR01451 family)